MTRATIMSAGAAAAWDSERPAGAAACAHMKARMIANPTRVYRLVTVTPRLISAMMPSDEALLDENSLALMGIAFPPRNCHSRPSQGSRTTQKVVPHPMQKSWVLPDGTCAAGNRDTRI